MTIVNKISARPTLSSTCITMHLVFFISNSSIKHAIEQEVDSREHTGTLHCCSPYIIYPQKQHSSGLCSGCPLWRVVTSPENASRDPSIAPLGKSRCWRKQDFPGNGMERFPCHVFGCFSVSLLRASLFHLAFMRLTFWRAHPLALKYRFSSPSCIPGSSASLHLNGLSRTASILGFFSGLWSLLS